MLCCLPWRRQGFRPRVGRWTVQTGLPFWYLWQDLAPLAQVVNLILNVVFGSRDMCLKWFDFKCGIHRGGYLSLLKYSLIKEGQWVKALLNFLSPNFI